LTRSSSTGPCTRACPRAQSRATIGARQHCTAVRHGSMHARGEQSAERLRWTTPRAANTETFLAHRPSARHINKGPDSHPPRPPSSSQWCVSSFALR
jgi:hypothetical protein